MRYASLTIIVFLLVSSCAWVKPTPGSNRVRIATHQAELVGCTKTGRTTVSLLDKVSYFKRDPKKVEEELFILGRNSAAEMGGDAILPVSEIFQGERIFEVYRCQSK